MIGLAVLFLGELIVIKRRLKFHWLTLALPIALLSGCVNPTSQQQPPLTVFLVRHAEKVDASEDPELSADGKERAAALVTVLRDAKLSFVHSTNFIRTRTTAEPIASESAVEIDLYEVGDLAGLANRLKSQGGRHLVVGHSNTTPELVELLGGDSGTKIQENEYDRLYLVTIGADGVASTVLLRYGAAGVPDQHD